MIKSTKSVKENDWADRGSGLNHRLGGCYWSTVKILRMSLSITVCFRGNCARRALELYREFAYAGAAAPRTAWRSAARASKRVESSVGSGEFESFMINGVSVQPSTTASQPASFIRPMTC